MHNNDFLVEEQQLEPEELIDQFNQELGEQREKHLETVIEIEQNLEQGLEPGQAIEELNEQYRELSKKRVNMVESDDFRPTKPLKSLRQPKRKDYDGKRGLEAHEPDLIEHKQKLDTNKDMTLKRAEHAYRRYRQQEGLEPLETVLDIPTAINELEGLKEGKKSDIYAVRSYLRDLIKVKGDEKQPENSQYAIPEDAEVIEDQIESASERIYEAWDIIKSKEENVQQALEQMKQEKDQINSIDIAIKYGIRPLETTVQGREKALSTIRRNWDQLGTSVKQDLPEEYSQRIGLRQQANI